MLAHLLSVLCLTAVKASEAKIIFRKSLSTEIPFLYAAGNPINVTLDIYNLGTGYVTPPRSAYNLKASDAWPRDYFDIEGEMEAEFDEVQASGHKQHNFTVTPKFDATPEKPLLYVRGFPAELIFSTDEAGEDRTCLSSLCNLAVLLESQGSPPLQAQKRVRREVLFAADQDVATSLSSGPGAVSRAMTQLPCSY
eukprot:11061-Amorphochlora_amoeboformis.AAC.1